MKISNVHLFYSCFKQILMLVTSGLIITSSQAELWDDVQHGYADNQGTKIHFASIGEGSLVVMVHGFPDFWYTWRDQMEVLKDHYKVVAMDQRGYNQSDQPEAPASYDMVHLVSDIAAVIQANQAKQAIVVGHDWGGAVAWQFAFAHPEMTEKLIILNLPHPNGFMRELIQNEEQRKNSAYAQAFKNGSHTDPTIFFGRPMTPDALAGWVTDESARKRYVEAFTRSNFKGMLEFYKRNYPDLPAPSSQVPHIDIRIKCPVLVIHGLKDTALNSNGLNQTWDWIDGNLTLVTVPKAGHFVQQDASAVVSRTMKWWLLSQD
ncbi:MAG: alpha/beta hydrolase [Verrucomicrobia bacterium]|nr:alpha/beta hydrolase [Verrucomicrobiota bacterium]